MRIGIVTAMAEETLPIYLKVGTIVGEGVVGGATVREIKYEDNTLYLATSGIGELRAALTAQLLKDIFEVEVILNFGFVGAINPKLNVGELVIVGAIVHHQFDISAVDGNKAVGHYDGREDLYFSCDAEIISRVQSALGSPLPVVVDASGDKFIASAEEKNRLRRTFAADICEMEAAGLALACERNNLPLFSLKVVSDKADENAIISFAEVLRKGMTKYEKLLPIIIKAINCDSEKPLPPARFKQ